MYGVSSVKATVEDRVYQANNERLFISCIFVFPVRYFKALKKVFELQIGLCDMTLHVVRRPRPD